MVLVVVPSINIIDIQVGEVMSPAASASLSAVPSIPNAIPHAVMKTPKRKYLTGSLTPPPLPFHLLRYLPIPQTPIRPIPYLLEEKPGVVDGVPYPQ